MRIRLSENDLVAAHRCYVVKSVPVVISFRLHFLLHRLIEVGLHIAVTAVQSPFPLSLLGRNLLQRGVQLNELGRTDQIRLRFGLVQLYHRHIEQHCVGVLDRYEIFFLSSRNRLDVSVK